MSSIIRVLVLLLCFNVFISCSEDGIIIPPNGIETPVGPEEPEESDEEIYFKFKEFESTFYTEDWIILHTSDGVLLDYRRYEKGQELEFKEQGELISDFISVTQLSVQKYGNNHNVEIYTTFDVKKGSEWNVPPPDYQNEEDEIIGEFALTLENFPEIIGLNISNENNLFISGYYNGPSTVFRDKYTYEVESVPLYEANSYAISFNEDQEDFKYYFLEDVQDLDDITINYNDFKFFDSYLEVDLPSGSYYEFSVNGLENYQDINQNSGYVIEKAHYSEDGYMNEYLDRNPLRIGYLDRFENFNTELKVYTNNYIYFFNKKGEKPDEINMPQDIFFSLVNGFLGSFEFDFNKEYIKYIATWTSETGVFDNDYVSLTWQIEKLSDSDQLLGEIPSEILEFYPITFEALEYEEIEFVFNEEEKVIMR